MVLIYPGSFDPMTFGHLDIIKRAASFSAELIVAVLNNSSKKAFFDVGERMEILREAVKDIGGGNIRVDSFSGLLIDYAKLQGTGIILRGLRAVTDFEYEFQMALTNRMLHSELETLFIPTSSEYLYLGSGVVKEIAVHGGDISRMVPPYVAKKIYNKIREVK